MIRQAALALGMWAAGYLSVRALFRLKRWYRDRETGKLARQVHERWHR